MRYRSTAVVASAVALVTLLAGCGGDSDSGTVSSSSSTTSQSAPECGFEHGWKKPGTYTLTATYVWQVAWTGDETGSMTQDMSSTQQVTVGELQSVATKP
jgi:hypothetical protein